VILVYEARCAHFFAFSYSLEDFPYFYGMKKLLLGTRSFSPQESWRELTVNLPESDHGWSSTIIQVSDPWDVGEEGNRKGVLTAWSEGPIPRVLNYPWKTSGMGEQIA